MIPGFVGTGPAFRSNSGSKRLCCLYVSVPAKVCPGLVGGHAWVPRLWAIRASTSPCNIRDPFENKLSCGRPNSPYSPRAESSRVGQGRLLGYIAPI